MVNRPYIEYQGTIMMVAWPCLSCSSCWGPQKNMAKNLRQGSDKISDQNWKQKKGTTFATLLFPWHPVDDWGVQSPPQDGIQAPLPFSEGDWIQVFEEIWLPSLKLTWPPKLDGWNTIVSFCVSAYFQIFCCWFLEGSIPGFVKSK